MARMDFGLYQLLVAADKEKKSFLSSWTPMENLGSGVFGTVYRVEKDSGLFGKQYAAVKIIEMKPGGMDYYVTEIEAMKSLSDEPHIVRIEDFSPINADGENFLAIRMELLHSLPNAGLSEAEGIRLGIEMCKALEKCHSHNPKVIHRDIKPANILMSKSGLYKLGDFGEARMLDASKAHSRHGSAAYMSPEVFNYSEYDNRADLYSLGLTLYAMLNGGWNKWPFYGDEFNAVNRRFSGEKFPEIPRVSRALQDIIMKMCDLNPDARYQTAAEVREALEELSKTPEWIEIDGKRIWTDVRELDLSYRAITDLTSLKYLANLATMDLWANNITDITPLKGLTNLTSLKLSSNKIIDITPLKGLTNLTTLWLGDNKITDITPLKGLTNLTTLWLGDNKITDITPLKGLTKLTVLRLWANNITDITPLKGLTKLTVLHLWGNNITDIVPLKGLTNLTELSLVGNNITAIDRLSLQKDLPNCKPRFDF